MTATDCARSCDGLPARTRIAAAPINKCETRRRNEVVISQSMSVEPDRVASILNAAPAAGRSRAAERPQADLQHDRMAQYRRRRTRSVGIGGDIVGGEDKAIVDVSGANHILIDLVCDEIPACGA